MRLQGKRDAKGRIMGIVSPTLVLDALYLALPSSVQLSLGAALAKVVLRPTLACGAPRLVCGVEWHGLKWGRYHSLTDAVLTTLAQGKRGTG